MSSPSSYYRNLPSAPGHIVNGTAGFGHGNPGMYSYDGDGHWLSRQGKLSTAPEVASTWHKGVMVHSFAASP